MRIVIDQTNNSGELNAPQTSPLNTSGLNDWLAQRESSNDYAAVNQLGYAGKYQFGGMALQDTGYKDSSGNWTGKDGINSLDAWLNNPTAQENAQSQLLQRNEAHLKNTGAWDYIGQEIQGQLITPEGLLAASHLVGAEGVNRMLRTGQIPQDANGTKALEYLTGGNQVAQEGQPQEPLVTDPTVGGRKRQELPEAAKMNVENVKAASAAKRSELSGLSPLHAQAASMEYSDFMASNLDIPWESRKQAWTEAQDLNNPNADAIFDPGTWENNLLGAVNTVGKIAGGVVSLPAAIGSIADMAGVSTEEMTDYLSIVDKRERGIDSFSESEQKLLENFEESAFGADSRFAFIQNAFDNQELAGAIQDAGGILDKYVDHSLTQEFTTKGADIFNKAFDGELSTGDTVSQITDLVLESPGAITQSTVESLPYIISSALNLPLTVASSFSNKYVEATEAYEKEHGEVATEKELATLVGWTATSALADHFGDRFVAGQTISITQAAAKLVGKEAAEKIGGNILSRTVKSAAGEVVAEGTADFTEQLASTQSLEGVDAGQSAAAGLLGGLSGGQTTATIDTIDTAGKATVEGAKAVTGLAADAASRAAYSEAVKTGNTDSLPEAGSENYDVEQDIIARRTLTEGESDTVRNEHIKQAAQNLTDTIKSYAEQGKKIPTEVLKQYKRGQQAFNDFKSEVARNINTQAANLASVQTANANTNQAKDLVLGSVELLTTEQAEAIKNNSNLDLSSEETTLLNDQIAVNNALAEASAEIADGTPEQPGINTLQEMLATATTADDAEAAQAVIGSAVDWRNDLEDQAAKVDDKTVLQKGVEAVSAFINQAGNYIAAKGIQALDATQAFLDARAQKAAGLSDAEIKEVNAFQASVRDRVAVTGETTAQATSELIKLDEAETLSPKAQAYVTQEAQATEASAEGDAELDAVTQALKEEFANLEVADTEQAVEQVKKSLAKGGTSKEAIATIRTQQGDVIADRVQAIVDEETKGTVDTTATRLTNPEGDTKIPPRAEGQSVAEWFRSFNLVKAYMVSGTDQDTLASPNLLQTIVDVFKQMTVTPTIIADHMGQALTEDQSRALNNLVKFDKLMREDVFNKVFDPNGAFVNADGVVFNDRDVMRYLGEDGNFEDNVKSAINVAIYNWIATRASDTLYSDVDRVRQLLGNTEEYTPTEQEMAYLTQVGVGQTTLRETLGKDILRSLNIKVTPEAPINLYPNMVNSLGQFAIEMMVNQGYLNETRFTAEQWSEISDQGGPETKIFLSAASQEVDGMAQLAPALKRIQELNTLANKGLQGVTFLDSLFGTQSHRTGPHLEPIKTVAKKMSRTNQKLGKAIRDNLKKHQARKHYLKEDNMNLFAALGDTALAEILGRLDPSKVHISREAKQEGINANLDRNIKYLNEFANSLESLDSPFFFEHEVWKTNRIGIKSNTVNPQGNKLHRAAIAQEGWRIEVDTSNVQLMKQFWNSMEEPLGVDSLAKLSTAKGGRLLEAVYDVKEFLESGLLPEGNLITEVASEYDDGALALDAMVNVARFLQSEESGSGTFYSDMFVEVDGKTNGPIIGLLQYAGAENADSLLDKLRKGGFLRKGDVTSISEFDGRDAYQEIAQIWAESIYNLTQNASDPLPLIAAQELFGDMLSSTEDGSIDITKTARNLAKNPLMVTVYGAGEQSVHESLGQELIEKIYNEMEYLSTNPSREGTRKLEQQVRILSGDNRFILPYGKEIDATLTKRQMNSIKEFVASTYGDAVSSAIETHYSHFVANRKIVNQGVDIMFRMYSAARSHAISAKLKELSDAGEVNPNVNNISVDDLKAIDKQLKAISPIIHNYFSKQADNINQGSNLGKQESVQQRGKGKSNFKQEMSYKTGHKVSAFGFMDEPAAPGVGPGVISIHNQDAAVQHILHGLSIDGIGVHDAYLWGIKDVVEGGQAQNEAFRKVMESMSVPEEVANALRRSAASFVQYTKINNAPELRNEVQKLRRTNKGSDKETFNAVISLANSAKKMKAEVLANTDYLDQYAAHDGSSAIRIGSEAKLENAVKEGEEVVSKLASTDHINQEEATDPTNYTTAEEVSRTNVDSVFAGLTDGTDLDTADHFEALRKLASHMSTKLVTPFTLHKRAQEGNANYGVMTPSDIFLTQAINGNTTPQMTVSGVPMSSREVFVHELSHMIYAHGLELDSIGRREIQRMFNAAKKELDYTAFLNSDIDVNHPANAEAVEAAKQRYDYIFGNAQGNQLHEFAAFALTNENFQNKLNQVPFPNKGVLGNSWYETIQNVFERLVDLLNGKLLNKGKLTNDQQLLRLLDSMLVTTNKKGLQEKLTRATDTLQGIQDTMTSRLGNSVMFNQDRNPLNRAIGEALRGDRENREITKDLTKRFNELRGYYKDTKYGVFTQLTDEFLGRTYANSKVRDMLRNVKHAVDMPRRKAAEAMTKSINESFLTDISEEERIALTQVVIKLDIDAVSNLGVEGLEQVLRSDNSLNDQIARLESQLNSNQYYNFYIKAARNLGYFMATGKSKLAVAHMNAHNIARLYGDKANMDKVNERDAALAEPIINKLATLYGIQATSPSLRTLTADVLSREQAADPVNNGFTAVIMAHKAVKEDAKQNQFNNQDESLMIKGWTKEEYEGNKSLKFAPASERVRLEAQGYIMTGIVPRDPTEVNKDDLYMFVAENGEKAPWMSQLVSLIDDARKGASTLDVERQYQEADSAQVKELRQAGLLPDDAPTLAQFNSALITYRKLKDIEDMHSNTAPPVIEGTPMIPVFNPEGDIVDWRYMAGEQLRIDVLKRNDDVAQVLGTMAGNIVSKVNSKQTNKEVAKMLREYWDEDKNTDRKDAYLWIGDTDSELTDLWRMIPSEMKDSLESEFNTTNGIWVRKDLVTQVFGYRKASVREVFDKDPDTRKGWEQLVTTVFDGIAKAITSAYPEFKYKTGASLAVAFESGVMNVIGEIKNIVIVKSGFVTISNFLSNTVYLVMNGMNPAKAVKYQYEGFKGINKYTKDENEIRQLQLEISNKSLNAGQIRNREARIAQLRRELSNNPVALTVRSGLMPTIAEDIDSRATTVTSHDKLVNAGLEYLPGWTHNTIKNVTQTRESELYHTMSNLVQQSDFVARHAMLKHWIETQEAKQGRQLSQQQFLYLVGEVEELFVNFDVPISIRSAQYLEDIGVGWFTKYAVRNIRSVARTAAGNPTGLALMFSGADLLGTDINSPFDSVGRFTDTYGTGSFVMGIGQDPWTDEIGIRNDIGFRLGGWMNMPWTVYGPSAVS